jgi:hypothetical protein
MNGKGDKRRKKTVDQETWDKNWEKIFKKEKPKESKDERQQRG